jgi:molybdopterin adenylyltransferase
MIKIGVINVSDRASAGIYEDIPGKAVVELLKEYLESKCLRKFAYW